MILERLKKIDEEFLRAIYVESEFIDPLEEILDRDAQQSNENRSTPFIVFEQKNVVSFFTVESSNQLVLGKHDETDDCWLESFFLTKEYLGKGYSKAVVTQIINDLPAHFPAISSLNLTVNFRNIVAHKVYKQCGFSEISDICHGGPAGPQYILKYKIPVE